MFASIDALSAPGSRVAVEVFGVDREQRKEVEERWVKLRAAREKRGEDVSFSPFELWYDDEDRPDCADWFAEHGWTTQTVGSREDSARLGRTPSTDDTRLVNNFVTARKH